MKLIGICAAALLSTTAPVTEMERDVDVTVNCTIINGYAERTGSFEIGLAGHSRHTMKVTAPVRIDTFGIF